MDETVVGIGAVEADDAGEMSALEKAKLDLNAAVSEDESDSEQGEPVVSAKEPEGVEPDDSEGVPDIDRPKPSDWSKLRGKYQSVTGEVKKLRAELDSLRGINAPSIQSAPIQSQPVQQQEVRPVVQSEAPRPQSADMPSIVASLADRMRECAEGKYGTETSKKARELERELVGLPIDAVRHILSKAKNGEYGAASSPIATTVREMLPEVIDRDNQLKAKSEHVREYNANVDRSLKAVLAKAPDIENPNSPISQYCRAAYQELAAINPAFMSSRADFPEVVYTHARRMMAEAKLSEPQKQQQSIQQSKPQAMSVKSVESGGRAPVSKRETSLDKARRELQEAVSD